MNKAHLACCWQVATASVAAAGTSHFHSTIQLALPGFLPAYMSGIMMSGEFSPTHLACWDRSAQSWLQQCTQKQIGQSNEHGSQAGDASGWLLTSRRRRQSQLRRAKFEQE